MPKTNNNIEGWHNAFARRVNCTRPDIYRLLDACKTEHSLTCQKMADMQRGFPARSTAARYIQNRNRLRAAIQRYEQGTLLDVMQAAKYSINMEMINVEEGEDQEEQ
jgi:hypothetical protein